MGALEEVTQMKSQGIAEEEIVRSLQEKGIAPQAIDDALSQSQIKNAIADEEAIPQAPTITPDAYTPQTQEISEMPPQQDYSQYPPQQQTQEYYPQEGYQQQYSGATQTDTIIEVSEQVFTEKSKQLQKQVEVLVEFQTLAKTTLDHLSDRLKRIETTIDKLQLAVLDKVGSYGKNLDILKKEVSMIEDTIKKKHKK